MGSAGKSSEYSPKRGHIKVQTTEIEQEIRNYLTEEFLFGHSETLNEDTALLGNVIDSQGVIELVSFLQQHFKIEVEDEEVTTENLATLRTVVALVEKKLRREG
jgi:acyl carrier protein